MTPRIEQALALTGAAPARSETHTVHAGRQLLRVAAGPGLRFGRLADHAAWEYKMFGPPRQ